MRYLAVALVCGFLLFSAPAHARRSVDLPYRLEQVWSTAVRLVRVDYGFEIIDRDSESGYLLFEYRSGERKVPGSIEVVRRDDREGFATHVIVGVPAMPAYVERMMLDKLRKKIEDEHGLPPKRRPQEPPTETNPDEGKQGGAARN